MNPDFSIGVGAKMKSRFMRFGFWINFLCLLAMISILSHPVDPPNPIVEWEHRHTFPFDGSFQENFKLNKVEIDEQFEKTSKGAQVYILNKDGEVYCLEKKNHNNKWLKELLEKS
jgi:hypothetical protein